MQKMLQNTQVIVLKWNLYLKTLKDSHKIMKFMLNWKNQFWYSIKIAKFLLKMFNLESRILKQNRGAYE